MLNTLLETLNCCQGDMRLLVNEPMTHHTSLKIGGCADIMIFPENEKQLISILKEANRAAVPVHIIGKGSNLLVLDGGIRGLVIKIEKEFSGIEMDGTQVSCYAGTSMAHLANTAAQNGLSGLEFASGIPGTVGGGVYMNAGAYDGEMKNVVTAVYGLTSQGEPFQYTNEDMVFGYRHSQAQDENLIITKVAFNLTLGKPEDIFAKMGDFNSRRREKQPLTDLSCGSTFKRPQGHFAGTLIEQCGLKGTSVGPCQVSEKHAGFLINHPGGTAKDFLALIALVQKTVYDKTGVQLEPEVRIIGEEMPIQLI